MKITSIFFAAMSACVILTGCSKSEANTAASSPALADPVKTGLEAKLKAMSPEERARYVQEHPDEIRQTYARNPGDPPAGQ